MAFFFPPETTITLLKQRLMKMQKFLASKRFYFFISQSHIIQLHTVKKTLMFFGIKEGLGRLKRTPPDLLKKGSNTI